VDLDMGGWGCIHFAEISHTCMKQNTIHSTI
jgi:hypothetical protein